MAASDRAAATMTTVPSQGGRMHARTRLSAGILAGLLNRTRKGTPCLSISDCATLDEALPQLRG